MLFPPPAVDPDERLAAATTDAVCVMWGARKPGDDLTMTTTIRAVTGVAGEYRG